MRKFAGDNDDTELDSDEEELDTSDHEELTDEDRTLMGDGDDDDDDDDDTAATPSTAKAAVARPVSEIMVTKEGLKKLQDELVSLEGPRRREVADRLKEAISYGDLSENSEYEDAKNEQAFVEGRISELREMVKNAKIITEKSGGKDKSVKVGSTVKIQNLTDKDDAETYTIVGATEASPAERKISNDSPIGAALMDQNEGDEVTVVAPAGSFRYKIVKVS
jgi:transcription elongation factor GreA